MNTPRRKDEATMVSEMGELAEQIRQVCENTDSNLVLGSLFAVAIPVILNAPDKAYALACVDYMESEARHIRALLTIPAKGRA